MISPGRSTLRPANIQTTSVKSWAAGQQSKNDVARLPTNGLFTTTNALLVQDGGIRPRPSMVLYGAQPVGTVLGEIFEFKDTTVLPNANYRICLQNVDGTTKAYYSKDLGAWTMASGKTFDNVAKAHFCQINNAVLIMNKMDNLSYLNISTKAVVPFVALTTPSAPTLTTNNALTGTTFTITYRIAANSTVGTTIGSGYLSVTVSTDRDLWNATTQSLVISWAAVTGAQSYNVYMGTGGIGTEYLIASGITGTTYTDNGTAYQDNTQSYPLVDSTAGPKAGHGDVINGQVFLTDILDDQYTVKVGGFYPYNLDFTPVHGGNSVPIGVGTKNLPVRVRLFRNFNGSSGIKVYCSGTNGHGKRYTMTPNTITVANTVVNTFDVTEDNGEDGTSSPDALIYYQDSNYYPSADGFKTDGTVPQLQNIISTRRITNTIQPDIASLNQDAMPGAVGIAVAGSLYFALPVGTTSNSQIWVNNLDLGGGWMKPLYIAADWMMQYNSNSVTAGGDGVSHFTVLSGNKIYELSYAQLTNDNGKSFATGFSSGRIFFSQDQRVCAKLLNFILTVLRPSGPITVTVTGQFKDSSTPITKSVTIDFSPSTSAAGWSEAGWSERGWSEIQIIPVTNNVGSRDIKVKVNKEVRWFEYSLSTIDPNVDYVASDAVAEYVTTGIRDV
jgi:hypothetical protein